MGSRFRKTVGILGVLPFLVAFQDEPAIFHAGTRLVEVEVIVRDKQVWPSGGGGLLKALLDSGPPFGPPGSLIPNLSKDDFTLLDNDQPQPIAVFREGSSAEEKPGPLPSGSVSNRQDSVGAPLNGATAILLDQLNTRFDNRGYEQLGMKKLLSSFTKTDSRVALYTLGESLHVLQDFTDNPQRLIAIAEKLDQPHSAQSAELSGAFQDFGNLMDLGERIVAPFEAPESPEAGKAEAKANALSVHDRMTTQALRLIIQHLAGVPGRRSLVWLMDEPRIPAAVMGMAQQANVVLYPVLVRAVSCFACPAVELVREHAIRDLAAATGGTGFFDVMDLPFALHAAQEDSHSSYVLGFYPTADMLDGKYHKIVVKLTNGKLDRDAEVHYRTGYLAIKVDATHDRPDPLSEAGCF